MNITYTKNSHVVIDITALTFSCILFLCFLVLSSLHPLTFFNEHLLLCYIATGSFMYHPSLILSSMTIWANSDRQASECVSAAVLSHHTRVPLSLTPLHSCITGGHHHLVLTLSGGSI